ncbi:MAG: tRNA lysidine(34) synthetase TilS [Vicinamibacterales bacterium]
MLAGLSGGSDSVALTFLLRELGAHLDFELVGLAHVNHGLRDTAGRDEDFCHDLAARLALPFITRRADVKRLAAVAGLSVEDAARRFRYDCLEQAAAELGASRIAVGHTRDDQAETFVLKLVRGAGLTGLGAIYPLREPIIRPLLEVGRTELRDYLAGRDEPWVEDETNADLSNPRNRVRLEVLPYLEVALGLPARRAIARAAGLAGEDARWLDELAGQRLAGLCVETAAGLELDADELRSTPRPLARRILLAALRIRANSREVSLEHVQAALDVLTGLAGGADVPGSRVELRGKKLVLLQ